MFEWDQLLPYATTALNWFLNDHSQEYRHFLYFGCGLYLPHLTTFLQPKLGYLGSGESITCLRETMRNIHACSTQYKRACSKQKCDKHDDVPHFKIGDLIMITNFNKNLTWTHNMYPTFE